MHVARRVCAGSGGGKLARVGRTNSQCHRCQEYKPSFTVHRKGCFKVVKHAHARLELVVTTSRCHSVQCTCTVARPVTSWFGAPATGCVRVELHFPLLRTNLLAFAIVNEEGRRLHGLQRLGEAVRACYAPPARASTCIIPAWLERCNVHRPRPCSTCAVDEGKRARRQRQRVRPRKRPAARCLRAWRRRARGAPRRAEAAPRRMSRSSAPGARRAPLGEAPPRLT